MVPYVNTYVVLSMRVMATKGRLSYHLCVECFSQLSFDSEVYTKCPFEKKEKEVFFRLTTFFFSNKKILFKEQLLFSFLCIGRQKKFSERSKKFFLKIYLAILQKKFFSKIFGSLRNFFLLSNT